jgi:hypothetical protein
LAGSSTAVKVVNVLIIVSLIAAAGVVGSILLTVAQAAPTLSIGSISATTSGGATQVQVPITLSNKGPLSVSDVSVQANVTDSSNDQLMTGTSGPLTVAPGETKSLNVQLNLGTNLPAATLQKLAETSQNLTVNAAVSTSIPPFVKVSGTVSARLAWGAPVSNLQVGTPSFAPLNATAVTASVPVSFQNQNDYLTLSGTGNITILDSGGKQVGHGALQVNVPPNSGFHQTASLVVGIPASQVQSLLLNDTTLKYTAQLSGSFNSFSYSTSQSVSVAWGAPVKGLTIGSLTATPYNSTYARFSAPVSFTDNSAFFGITGTISGGVTDSSQSQVGSITPLSVSVSPGQQFSSTLSGFIKIASASQRPLTLNLSVQTPYGSVSKQVVITA